MAKSEPKGSADAAARVGVRTPAAAAAPAAPRTAPAGEPGMIALVNAAAAAAERARERARAASLHGLALRLAELKEFALRLEPGEDREVAELLEMLSRRI